MSSLMDRLKDVEEKGSSGRGGPERTSHTPLRIADRGSRTDGPELSNRNSELRNAKSGVWRALACLLVIFAAFLIWRTWLREEPGGQTKPAAGDQSAETSKRAAGRFAEGRPARTRAAAGPFEKGASATPGAKEAGARATTGKPSRVRNLIRRFLGSEKTTAPPRIADWRVRTDDSEIPSPKSEMPFRAPAREILTPQEDARTKDFLLNLKVSGVCKDANGYAVLINGRQYRKGAKIEQIEIAEIASNRITFAYKGKRYHLPIR